jgi:2-C-methyl-D-erythritol 2,4-cyclodiphosphate synthase
MILEDAMSEMRAGIGYDIHRLVEGRALMLGGARMEFPKGLLGYSDGDALLHAICDALLGAAGLGDIGGHFPDTDPAYKGVASIELVKRVAVILAKSGWEVVNVDANVIAERPKIGPYVGEMKKIIGGALGIPAERVSIKGRTREGLGEVGRGEAIAAQAVAMIKKKD